MTDAFDAGFDGIDFAPVAEQPVAEQTTEPTEPAQVEQGADTEPKAEPVKTFTQAELDTIVEKRLSREKSAHEKALKENPLLSGLERAAARSGMTPDQLIAALEQQQIAQMAEADGITVEAATRIVQAETKAKALESEVMQYKTTEQQKEADAADFSAFVSAYPDVKPDAIPQEVWEAKGNGRSLTDAYRDYELKSLKSEIAALKQQKENRSKAPLSGGVGTNGNKTEPEDPFLRGFDSF